MKIDFKHILITLLVVIALIGLNLYQWQNPKVVEVPEGQTAIDSTAWIQRSITLGERAIIDSLKSEKKALAERIRKSNDQIANYTEMLGSLRLENDSLQVANAVRLDSLLAGSDTKGPDLGVQDTTVRFQQPVSDSLLLVTSDVRFEWPHLHNELSVEQQRPIKLNVVNTISEDQSRVLTYIHSPDFEQLDYQSYTALEPKRKVPWFWIGLGAGIIGGSIISITSN